jgi:hypothetical protein
MAHTSGGYRRCRMRSYNGAGRPRAPNKNRPGRWLTHPEELGGKRDVYLFLVANNGKMGYVPSVPGFSVPGFPSPVFPMPGNLGTDRTFTLFT